MTDTTFVNDIPEDIARQAHAGTSFDPELRGRQERMSYANTLAQDHANLSALADTDDKRKNLTDHFAWYRAKYRERYVAMLSAKGRCVSTMIAGRSNFNVGRAQKSSNAADKRTAELIEFRTKALATIRKILTPELAPIMASDNNAGDRLADKLAKLERAQERMKAANAAIRKHAKDGPEAQVAALIALGHNETIARELLKPDFAGRVGFADYRIKNNGAEIRRLKGRAVAVERAQSAPETSYQGQHARMEDAPADNRVRLFFPDKPSPVVRDFLKSRGFRWAPSIGCWQAYRNPGSLEAARQVAGGELPDSDPFNGADAETLHDFIEDEGDR